MNTKLLVPLLATVALLSACNKRDENKTETPPAADGTATTPGTTTTPSTPTDTPPPSEPPPAETPPAETQPSEPPPPSGG